MNKKKRIILLGLIELNLFTVLTGVSSKKQNPVPINISKITSSTDDSLFGEFDYDERLSYNDVKKIILEKQKQDKICKCSEVVDKYSSIYGIDSKVVNKVIKQNTNDYSSYNFLYNNNISFDNEVYSDFSLQILYLVRDIYRNPENYGYKIDEIRDIREPNIDMTIREYINETSEILGIDPDFVLAIACAESGFFQSSIATKKNNPFALRSSKFNSYNNLWMGITEGMLNLKNNYIDRGCTNFQSMARKYCPEGTDHWISLVNGCYNQIKNGKKLYDEDNNTLIYK